MSEPFESIKVEFDLTPETVIGHTYRQTGEEDYAETPITLADRVAELVAKGLAAKIHAELREAYAFRAADIANKVAEDRARELIDAALAKITQPTDSYGSPKGEPKTIAELIDDKITAWFKAPRDSYDRKTNLAKLLDDAVDHALKRDMNGAVAAAKKQALAAITAEAQKQMETAFASIITAQVTR